MRLNLPLIRKSLLLLLFTASMGFANAQPCATGKCADLNNPGSANWFISQVFVADINGVPLTESNVCSVQDVYLFAISGGTSSNAYTLKVYFEVYINGVLNETFDKCLYTSVKIPTLINLGKVDWDCSESIELRNVYLAWQPNAGRPCACNDNNCLFAQRFTVNTPLDNQPPVVTCPTVNPSYPANNGACTASLSFMATATDNQDPNPAIAYYIGSDAISFPYSFPVGSTTVTVVASDSRSNSSSCTFTVVVADTQAPTITCPGPVTVNADAGFCDATGVALGTPTTNDNCGVLSTSNNAPSVFPKGNTTVIWTVTDLHGNTATCSQVVTVVDNQKPSITCPANITVTQNHVNGANVNFSAQATDNCTGVSVSYSHVSGTMFPVGTTTVTATATDASGNTEACSFTVTVNEWDCLTIGACGQTYVVELYPVRFRTTTVYRGYLDTEAIKNTVVNNCVGSTAGLTYVFSQTVFTPQDWGNNNPVTIWVTDQDNNTIHCTFNVIVRYPLKSGDALAFGYDRPDLGNMNLDMQIFPNPTAGKLKVEMRNLNDPRITAVVYNTNGAVVLHRELTTDGQIELDLTGNVSGLYLLRLVADKREFLEKIILTGR